MTSLLLIFFDITHIQLNMSLDVGIMDTPFYESNYMRVTRTNIPKSKIDFHFSFVS